MAHLRHLTDWPTVEGDPARGEKPGPRPATKRELLARWLLVVVGEHPGGGWICDCGRLGPEEWGEERAGAHDDLPGTRMGSSGPPERRYTRSGPVAAAHACRAIVFRASDGSDLRAAHAKGRPILRSPVGAPPLRGVTAREADPPAVVAAVRAAFEAQNENVNPAIERLRVPVGGVLDSDVVVTAWEPGHRFSGER